MVRFDTLCVQRGPELHIFQLQSIDVRFKTRAKDVVVNGFWNKPID